MISPAPTASVSPETTYRPAIFQPNMPNSMTSATSLTIGAEIRKDSVTPSGMPDSTKPMNSGTAEHEQKGVITPSSAASPLPTPARRPPSQRRVCSGEMKVRSKVIR